MRMTGMYPSSIRLPPDIKKVLARAAKVQGCSISFKITEILRKWAKEWDAQQQQEAGE